MNDINKATLTDDESIPLVQASLLTSDTEMVSEIPTEYVVIDNPELVSVSSNSFGTSISIAQATTDTTRASHSNWRPRQYQDSYYQRYQDDLSSAPSVPTSNVDPSKTCGAWAAGIVLGFLMGVGPSLSMAFGIGAAYYSQQEEGIAGDVARAMGDVAILSHKRFVQVNEKHNLVYGIRKGTVDLSKQSLMALRKSIEQLLFKTDQKNDKEFSRHRGTDQATIT